MKRKRTTYVSVHDERLLAELLRVVLAWNRHFNLPRADLDMYYDICRRTDGDNDAVRKEMDVLYKKMG